MCFSSLFLFVFEAVHSYFEWTDYEGRRAYVTTHQLLASSCSSSSSMTQTSFIQCYGYGVTHSGQLCHVILWTVSSLYDVWVCVKEWEWVQEGHPWHIYTPDHFAVAPWLGKWFIVYSLHYCMFELLSLSGTEERYSISFLLTKHDFLLYVMLHYTHLLLPCVLQLERLLYPSCVILTTLCSLRCKTQWKILYLV